MRYWIVLVTLTGCATHWEKPGATNGDFTQDRYACERDAAPLQDSVLRSRMMGNCLSAKGWQKVKRRSP